MTQDTRRESQLENKETEGSPGCSVLDCSFKLSQRDQSKFHWNQINRRLCGENCWAERIHCLAFFVRVSKFRFCKDFWDRIVSKLDFHIYVDRAGYLSKCLRLPAFLTNCWCDRDIVTRLWCLTLTSPSSVVARLRRTPDTWDSRRWVGLE